MMQFITVFPYIRMPSVDDEILVYPAEISITHFSLYRGTMSCWSSLVDFDPIYLGVNRHRCDYNVVEKNAAILGIHHPMTRFCTPFDVFKRLMEKQCSPGVFVCDAEQVEIVERALAFLASTVTLKEQREHADVLERMVTAQDFITDLLQLYFDLKGTPVPHHLRDELIILEFNSAREKLWKFSRLCCYHERKPTGHESRKHCPVSRTAVLIAAVCKLSFSANMDDFRDHYDASKYLMERVSVNRLQNDSSLSKSTEHVLHNKTAAADGGATDKHIMANASTNFKYLPIKFQKLRYEVVKAQENPFQRRTKVKLDLIDAINRMRKLVS
ncbi:hypothetical protein KIN20_016659 [Parelaphostrongylus tenuis]|nr:hypothetical protein KIN20_016659 [Parelaphostrongylus tenuis]